MNTEIFSIILQKFISKSPVTVMVQGLLEYLLNADKLDEWFTNNSETQYTRNLLFSSVIAIMLEVVCQIRRNINVAYQKSNYITVSLTSLYNKINGIELKTSAALVNHIGIEAAILIKTMNAENPAWLPHYRTKLLDGNCLKATQHRIKELRTINSAALPGKSLVVFDPQTELAINVFLCEDGHAQERQLLNKVLETVEVNDLWVADRNFCTQDFLFGIQNKKAVFVIRQHQNIPIEIITEEQFIAETETGKIYEQKIKLKSTKDEYYSARKISIRLNKKTRNGDNDINILTSLPMEMAYAIVIAVAIKNAGELRQHFNDSKRILMEKSIR